MADSLSAGSDQVHKYDDLDKGTEAHHHTLGTGRHQAMPGDILSESVLTDLASVIAALKLMGAQ